MIYLRNCTPAAKAVRAKYKGVTRAEFYERALEAMACKDLLEVHFARSIEVHEGSICSGTDCAMLAEKVGRYFGVIVHEFNAAETRALLAQHIYWNMVTRLERGQK